MKRGNDAKEGKQYRKISYFLLSRLIENQKHSRSGVLGVSCAQYLHFAESSLLAVGSLDTD